MITELQSAISQAPSRKERMKNLTRVESVKLRVERAALLFRGAPIAIGVSLFNAGIATAIAWGEISTTILLAWLGAVVGLAAIRAGVWFRFRATGSAGRKMTRFASVHVVFMAINGALWGALAPIFAVHGMLGQAFLPFVIAGMTAAAVISAGASWRAVIAFNVPALAPLAASYLIVAEAGGMAIAAVVAIYGAATIFFSDRDATHGRSLNLAPYAQHNFVQCLTETSRRGVHI